jgi:hypothetical protein
VIDAEVNYLIIHEASLSPIDVDSGLGNSLPLYHLFDVYIDYIICSHNQFKYGT